MKLLFALLEIIVAFALVMPHADAVPHPLFERGPPCTVEGLCYLGGMFGKCCDFVSGQGHCEFFWVNCRWNKVFWRAFAFFPNHRASNREVFCRHCGSAEFTSLGDVKNIEFFSWILMMISTLHSTLVGLPSSLSSSLLRRVWRRLQEQGRRAANWASPTNERISLSTSSPSSERHMTKSTSHK